MQVYASQVFFFMNLVPCSCHVGTFEHVFLWVFEVSK